MPLAPIHSRVYKTINFLWKNKKRIELVPTDSDPDPMKMEMKKIPKHNSGSQPNALIDVHFICMETARLRYLKTSLLDTCKQSFWGKHAAGGPQRKRKPRKRQRFV